MDDETKDILLDLRQGMLSNKKPRWLQIFQGIIVPSITVILTVLLTLNKVENNYHQSMNDIKQQIIKQQTDDEFIRNEIGIIKRRQDYNNSVIQNEINDHINNAHIQLIELQ